MAESITSQRRAFLSPGHKGWTEIKKYGKICIRNDVVKLEFMHAVRKIHRLKRYLQI